MQTTITVRGKEYSVAATGKSGIPYLLKGPRGGMLTLIRNVRSGLLIAMAGSSSLRETKLRFSDASGELVAL